MLARTMVYVYAVLLGIGGVRRETQHPGVLW